MADTLRKDIKEKIENGQFNCEKELTLSIISGKWKVVILYHLYYDGPYRFNKLQKLFGNISNKILTSQLRELMEDGIIQRKVYDEIPPKVEYLLTELGITLIPIIDLLYDWGKKRMNQIKKEMIK